MSNNPYTPPAGVNGPHLSPSVYGPDYVNSYSVIPRQRQYQQQQHQQQQHQQQQPVTSAPQIEHQYSHQHYGHYGVPSPPQSAYNTSASVSDSPYNPPLTRYHLPPNAANTAKPGYQQLQYPSSNNDLVYWHAAHLQQQQQQQQRRVPSAPPPMTDLQRQQFPVSEEFMQYSYIPQGPLGTHKQFALPQPMAPQTMGPYAGRYQTAMTSANGTSLSPTNRRLPRTQRLTVTDPKGQTAPPNIRPKVTTTLWEDESTLCFQVETRGICVARREDNDMVNGTKLLNVTGITRGRRDGILKAEKVRHVVKCGSMHLKGVWISYDRALQLANQERITDLLYPLFVKDIKAVLYHPLNYARTAEVLSAAERSKKQKLDREKSKFNPASRKSQDTTLAHLTTPRSSISSEITNESPSEPYMESTINTNNISTTHSSPALTHHNQHNFGQTASFVLPLVNSNTTETMSIKGPSSSTESTTTSDFSSIVTPLTDSPGSCQNIKQHQGPNKGLAILNHPDPHVSSTSTALIHNPQ